MMHDEIRGPCCAYTFSSLALRKLILPLRDTAAKDLALTLKESWPLHSEEIVPPLTTGKKELKGIWELVLPSILREAAPVVWTEQFNYLSCRPIAWSLVGLF